MEYQKIINLLDNTTNHPSKFRIRVCVEINDEWKERYDNSNIRFKSTKIRSGSCDYSDAYILVKGIIKVPNTVAVGAAVNNANKKVIFKNCAPFTDCITEISNTQIDDAQKIDVVMPMYSLIEYSMLIRRHQEVYGNIIELKQLQSILVIFLIFLMITWIVLLQV